MDQCDSWLECDKQPELLDPSLDQVFRMPNYDGGLQQWDGSFAAPITDSSSSDQMLLRDSLLELDGTSLSLSSLQDIEASSPESTWRPQYEDRVRGLYNGYSSLSISEERELREIAMPSYVLADQTHAEAIESSCSPEPEPKTRRRAKKRTTLQENEGTEAVIRKRGHNAIEKRYRTNLNGKIMALRQSIPSLKVLPDGEQLDTNVEEDEDNPDAAHKCGKAAILTGAVDYISYLEENIERLGSEANIRNARVRAFERLAMSGSTPLNRDAYSRIATAETLQSIQAGMSRKTYPSIVSVLTTSRFRASWQEEEES